MMNSNVTYGNGPGQVDCSGSVDQAYPGHFPERMTAADQYNYEENTLHEEGIPYDQLKPGDIAYWSKMPGGNVSHTAVVESVDQRGVHILNASASANRLKSAPLKRDGSIGGWGSFKGGARPR